MNKMTFWGYKRPDGRVGIRNKILILPASVCASDTTIIIASPSITRMDVLKYLPTSNSPWMLWRDMQRIPMFMVQL